MEFSEVVEVLDRGKSVDVLTSGSFDHLMISSQTLEKLKAHGFKTPSPVQEKAIPIGLVGRDMLVQAKSGTGKTLVFSVLAIENVETKRKCVQKLIIAPTREIATQIRETVKKLAPTGTKILALVGGISLNSDIQLLKQQCPHIVIGTTGRICQLVSKKELDLSQVDFFALDEADKLMDDCFQKDINFIISCLPPMRQVAVFSATYPRSLDILLSTFLRDAALVRFNAEDVQLVGIKQYVITKCSPMLESLGKLLKLVQFSQALVFCDMVEKCQPICTYLVENGFEAGYVSSAMSQRERQSAIDNLKHYRVKILVSSDLTSRGIDADRVNMVVNIETAISPETYFHRIGRAARFGGQGAAVTLLENDQSVRCFTAMVVKGRVKVKRVKMDDLPYDLPVNTNYWQISRNFIEIDRAKKTKNEALENVPSREDAEKTLAEERGESRNENYKYDRETMLELKETVKKSPEGEVEEPPINDQNERDKENRAVVPPPVPIKEYSVELEELKELKKAVKVEELKQTTPEPAVKPKYKFVPTRQKAKTKFYMRGELMAIRNVASDEEWRSYASSKYNLKEEPFIDSPSAKTEVKTKSVQNGVETKASTSNTENKTKSEEIKARPHAKPKKSKKKESVTKEEVEKTFNDGVLRYNRRDMIGIQMGVPKNEWVPYIEAKYNTKEEPWELDQTMRCSFEERLRRIRAKEKAERKKVIEDRKNARKNQDDLVSSGRTSEQIEIPETSFTDYCARLNRELEEYTLEKQKNIEEGKKARRIGPVVPLRDPPNVWKYRVDMYKTRLEELDREFEYELNMVSGKVAEIEIQTENTAETAEEEKGKKPQGKDADSQTDLNYEASVEKVEKDDDEAAESEESNVIDRLLKDMETIEEEGGNDEYFDAEECAEEEDLDAESESENDSDSSEDREVDHMRDLADQYRRNVEFNIVFETYFQSMNRFNARRS